MFLDQTKDGRALMDDKVKFLVSICLEGVKLELVALDLFDSHGNPYHDEQIVSKWPFWLLKRIRKKKAKMFRRLEKMKLVLAEHSEGR